MRGELNTMQTLISGLYDYASDEEESQNILLTMHSISLMKESISGLEQTCELTDLQLETLINEVKEEQQREEN
jgi:hypothetical protein